MSPPAPCAPALPSPPLCASCSRLPAHCPARPCLLSRPSRHRFRPFLLHCAPTDVPHPSLAVVHDGTASLSSCATSSRLCNLSPIPITRRLSASAPAERLPLLPPTFSPCPCALGVSHGDRRPRPSARCAPAPLLTVPPAPARYLGRPATDFARSCRIMLPPTFPTYCSLSRTTGRSRRRRARRRAIFAPTTSECQG